MKKTIMVRKTGKYFPNIVGKNDGYHVSSWKRDVPLQELLDKGYTWGQGSEFIGGYEYEYMKKMKTLTQGAEMENENDCKIYIAHVAGTTNRIIALWDDFAQHNPKTYNAIMKCEQDSGLYEFGDYCVIGGEVCSGSKFPLFTLSTAKEVIRFAGDKGLIAQVEETTVEKYKSTVGIRK